ncbi:hypothetical protein N9V96_04390, partial [Polaribacter sp.]|nr:hypothetical protein [Polaribacter sp.]
YTLSLGYFTLFSSDFVSPNGTPIVAATENIEYRIFDNQVLKENLIRQDFDIEITNTFNRSFEISLNFLDNNRNNTYQQIRYVVPANTQNFKESIVIDNINTSNSRIKDTERITVSISLEDASVPLGPDTVGAFNFQSSTTIYLKTSIKEGE